MRQVLPKWQIATGVSTQRATLKPGSAPQKATLLTKNGPQDVSAIDQDLLTYLFLPFDRIISYLDEKSKRILTERLSDSFLLLLR